MKTTHSILNRRSKIFLRPMLLFIMALSINLISAQNSDALSTSKQDNLIVKGLVKDQFGPLEGANISLKGTGIGVVSDIDGLFSFNKTLNKGDILVFSYMGYELQEVEITPAKTYLEIVMIEKPISSIGDLASDIPFKSQRSN